MTRCRDRHFGALQLIEGSGLHRRTIERYLYDRMIPRSRHREVLTKMAVQHATDHLIAWQVNTPGDVTAVMHLYLSRRPVELASTCQTALPILAISGH